MTSIIENNMEIIHAIKEIYLHANHDQLRELFAKHFIPTEEERKQNAEIATPVSLVNEMLSKIPLDFWTKPQKVFEPCCGKGNFVLGIFDCFFKGLEIKYPNINKRCRIIIEKCIYYADINELDVFITTELLKYNAMKHGMDENKAKQLKFNSNVGNTLELEIKEKWKINGFEAVIGNPPYHKYVGKRKTNTLWDKFVIKSLFILNQNGFLVSVHPSGWRNIDGKFKNIQKEIFKNNLIYLEIHNEKDGLKTFNMETRYDWYVLQKTNVKTTYTNVKFQDGSKKIINVNCLEFIPNGNYDIIMSLIAKENDTKVTIIHSYYVYETRKKHMAKIKNDMFKYPCVYTVNSKDELTYFYSAVQHGHYGIPKLIWSNGRISSIGSYIDCKGQYGLTQFAYALVDEINNLNNIKKAFDNKKFREIMELCAVGQLTINYKIMSLFKKDFWKEFI